LFYPISKQKYNEILEGIRQHSQGLNAVDPFTKKIIPPHTLKSKRDYDVYWLLYNFTHWELKLFQKYGAISIRIAIVIMVFMWIVLAGTGSILWYLYPDLYIIWGYVIILAIFLILYDLVRWRPIHQMLVQKVTQDEIQGFLQKT